MKLFFSFLYIILFLLISNISVAQTNSEPFYRINTQFYNEIEIIDQAFLDTLCLKINQHPCNYYKVKKGNVADHVFLLFVFKDSVNNNLYDIKLLYVSTPLALNLVKNFVGCINIGNSFFLVNGDLIDQVLFLKRKKVKVRYWERVSVINGHTYLDTNHDDFGCNWEFLYQDGKLVLKYK